MFKQLYQDSLAEIVRNKLHSLINTGGLIIDFTIGLITFLFVYSQYRLDTFHEPVDRIYEAYQVFDKKANRRKLSTNLGLRLPQKLKESLR